MSGQAPVWRAILWIERFLPSPERVMPRGRDAAATGARSNRWRFVILPMVPLFSVLPTLVRDHAFFGTVWLTWLPVIPYLFLGLAVVVALAAIIAGVVTWRREHRDHA